VSFTNEPGGEREREHSLESSSPSLPLFPPFRTACIPELYSISPNHTSTLLLSPVSCSNGTGWSPDSSLLYYVDSGEEASIHLFDYDLETGGISNRREFAKDTFGDGGTFDGLTMDEEGCVWVARWKSEYREGRGTRERRERADVSSFLCVSRFFLSCRLESCEVQPRRKHRT